MRQLTQKEHQIYSDYIITELISQFQKYGKVTLDDLRQLININYEISEITDNIYPILEFSSDYNAIKNITKFNMNTYPNNLGALHLTRLKERIYMTFIYYLMG